MGHTEAEPLGSVNCRGGAAVLAAEVGTAELNRFLGTRETAGVVISGLWGAFSCSVTRRGTQSVPTLRKRCSLAFAL